MVTENKIYKMEILKEYLDLSSFAHSFGYLLSAFVLFFVGKVTYKFLNPKINIQSELVEKDNLAFISIILIPIKAPAKAVPAATLSFSISL